MASIEMNEARRKNIIGIIVAGAFLSFLGQSLLTSSIPILSKIFHVSEAVGTWLTTSYILVLGVISALTACLINRLPTRKIFLGSMSVFAFGCLLSPFAWNFPVLLISRIIQAIGAGVLMPLAQVVALHLYPRKQHGHAFAVIGIAVAFAPAIGPTLAGILVDLFGWRSIFYLMFTLLAIVTVAGFCFLKNVGINFHDRFDALSALFYAMGFCALMIGVSAFSGTGSKIYHVLLPIIIGILLLLVFVIRSFKLEHPLLRLQLFINRDFTLTFLLIVVGYIASMSAVMLVPLYLQTARGISETICGLVILPGALSTLIANPIGGKMLDSKGPRPVAVLGMAIMTAGTAAFCIFDRNISLILVGTAYCARMFGMTLFMNPLTAYCAGGLKGAEISHGNAIIASMRQMLGTLSAAALVAVTETASSNGSTDVHGINVSFSVQTILYLIGLATAIVFIKSRKP